MARRFLDDIRAAIDAQMPDNTVGAITPAIMRTTLKDMIDSTIQDEAFIYGTTPTQINLTAAWVPVPVSFFQYQLGGDPDFLKINLATASITTAATAGFTYEAIAIVNMEAAQNNEAEFAIAINGVVSGLRVEVVGRGPGRSVNGIARDLSVSTPSNAVYTLMARAPSGGVSAILVSAGLAVTVLPTNNP